MNTLAASETTLREVIIDVARLPADDLSLVAAFVTALKQRPHPTPRNLDALRAEVQRKAAELANVPREQLAAQFLQLADKLRAEAIAKGLAIETEANES